MENKQIIQQASVPTTLPESPANLQVEVYAKGAPMSVAMLNPTSIQAMTQQYRSADDTVALWTGAAYVPSLQHCIHELGRERVEAMLKIYLIRLNVATNASRPLTEEVIESMVPVILDHIVNDLETTITLADLRIVMDRAMRGYYGKPYGGFGCQEICGWFDQYNREKMDAIDAFELRRKDAEIHGSRTNHRGREVARMRDAMHQYNLENMKKELQKQQDND